MEREQITSLWLDAAEADDAEAGRKAILATVDFILDGVERIVAAVEQIAENGK